MTGLTLYEITVPIFIRNLHILSFLLEKGSTHAKASNGEVTEEKLLESKLIADMGDFIYQS